jgi:hypothetical protein
MKIKLNFVIDDIEKKINEIPGQYRDKFLNCYYKYVNSVPGMCYNILQVEFDLDKVEAKPLLSKKLS